VAVQAMDFQVKNVKSIADGCDLIAIENDSAKWKNARKMPRLIRFLRTPDMVDESKVRAVLDDAKSQNMVRGMMVISSGFSGTALEFANSRPIELFNKEKLQELLERVNFSASKRRS
jgi:hypothetical protein